MFRIPPLEAALAARRQPVLDALADEASLRAERVAHLEPVQHAKNKAMEGLKGIHWADFFELKRREFFIPELLKRIFDCVMILRGMTVAKDVGYELDTDFHGVQKLAIEDSYDCVPTPSNRSANLLSNRSSISWQTAESDLPGCVVLVRQVLPLLQTKWSTHGAERCSLVSELLAFNLDGVNDETIELLQPYLFRRFHVDR